MRKIFFILSLFVLVSCSKALDVPLDPEVSVYLSNDSEKIIQLTAKDKEYLVLQEWLTEHSSDWHPTSGRYPGGIYLTSGSYGIQITETQVVLYSINHPKPKAMYIQKIGKGELIDIRNIGK